jgi:hypothetical protein
MHERSSASVLRYALVCALSLEVVGACTSSEAEPVVAADAGADTGADASSSGSDATSDVAQPPPTDGGVFSFVGTGANDLPSGSKVVVVWSVFTGSPDYLREGEGRPRQPEPEGLQLHLTRGLTARAALARERRRPSVLLARRRRDRLATESFDRLRVLAA